ncbi:MAG: TGS domain-containing protein, partial [Bacteroidales bacterium]|nr:TGS domain-containing protein [Bacteroidales bacterium]
MPTGSTEVSASCNFLSNAFLISHKSSEIFAESISPRLANDVLCASVNDQVYDLERPILEDATLKLHKWEDREAKNVFWHSSSHLMAEALEALYPGIRFGIGPAIENGFYYDVDLGDKQLVEADLRKIEEKMLELA